MDTRKIIELDWLEPELLTKFIDELRIAGYKIGVSQYIAAHDLILTLMAQGQLNKPEQLKTLLGPIFCSSPTEQADFQKHFDQWAELLRGPHSPLPEVQSSKAFLVN